MPEPPVKTGEVGAAPGRLNLYSMAKLEVLLGVPRAELRAIAESAGSFYEPFQQVKAPRPFAMQKKTAKVRTIDNPTGRLKEIQKTIYSKLLRPLALPHYLYGGVPGRTVLENVLQHHGAPVLVTMDIRNFFPTVSNIQVYQVWRHLLDCSPEISSILTRLTTFERHLPQGAPTSTILANLVLFSVDEPIRTKCAELDVSYSTWVDDLAFSGPNARQVIKCAIGALRLGGFTISHRKLKIMGPGSRKVLNGVLLGKFPSVVRERLRQIRSGIHKLRTCTIRTTEIASYARSLEGQIGYVASVVPAKARKLAEELDFARLVASGRR